MPTLIRQIVCLIFFIVSIEAQPISGNIKDFNTNEDLIGVSVNFINPQNGTSESILTDDFGNWEYTFSPVEVKGISLPDKFRVEQNYPNPFNPSTVISFTMGKTDNITLEVYDILGRSIDRRSFYLQRGSYDITYEGKGSAGIYFYTITDGSNSITKKMIQLDGGNGRGILEPSIGTNNNFNKSTSIISTELTIVYSKFSYVNDTINVSINGGEVYNTILETLHSKSVLVDLHNDILERIYMEDPNYHLADYHTYFETDIPRLKTGNMDLEFFAAWVHPTAYAGKYFQTTMELIDRFKLEVSLNEQDLVQAYNHGTAMEVINSGKIAGVIGVEGGHSIENSIDNLIQLYDAGMRYMTITWNNSTDWAISAQHPNSLTEGLSEFGREVIKKMDSLGVIIDVSHTGIKTIDDILEVTQNPIIATHSGARAIKNHYRNLYNSQLRDIANSGGVIGIVFYPPFVGDYNNTGSTDIDDVIKHIDYIVNYVGIDYVAIGSDFDGTGGYLPLGLEDVTKFPDLTYALLEHGYSQDDVSKILGKNFLRVFKQVCK